MDQNELEIKEGGAGAQAKSVDDLTQSEETTFQSEKKKQELEKKLDENFRRYVRDEVQDSQVNMENIGEAAKEHRQDVEVIINETFSKYAAPIVRIAYRLGIIDQGTFYSRYRTELQQSLKKQEKTTRKIEKQAEAKGKEITDLIIHREELFELMRNYEEMKETVRGELGTYDLQYRQLISETTDPESRDKAKSILKKAYERKSYLKKLEKGETETALKIKEVRSKLYAAERDLIEIDSDYANKLMTFYRGSEALSQTPVNVSDTGQIIRNLQEDEKVEKAGEKYEGLVDRIDETNLIFKEKLGEETRKRYQRNNGKNNRKVPTSVIRAKDDTNRLTQTYIDESKAYEKEVRQSDTLFK